MTNGGPALDYWQSQITDKSKRVKFVVSMVSQLMHGLKQLHSFGYSHGDLKIQNICARPRHDGKFKFTLIDLGVTSKLPLKGESTAHKKFRGNLLTASPDHIRNRRPGGIDDIYSLLCVAHQFIHESLPWREYINKYMESHDVTDQRKVYLRLRRKLKEAFDHRLCHKTGELNELFVHVCKARKQRNLIDQQFQDWKRIGSQPHSIDYDELLLLLPQMEQFSKEDLEVD